jgi:hypothetical protein
MGEEFWDKKILGFNLPLDLILRGKGSHPPIGGFLFGAKIPH